LELGVIFPPAKSVVVQPAPPAPFVNGLEIIMLPPFVPAAPDGAPPLTPFRACVIVKVPKPANALLTKE
jgi:hypothetical protein